MYTVDSPPGLLLRIEKLDLVHGLDRKTSLSTGKNISSDRAFSNKTRDRNPTRQIDWTCQMATHARRAEGAGVANNATRGSCKARLDDPAKTRPTDKRQQDTSLSRAAVRGPARDYATPPTPPQRRTTL